MSGRPSWTAQAPSDGPGASTPNPSPPTTPRVSDKGEKNDEEIKTSTFSFRGSREKDKEKERDPGHFGDARLKAVLQSEKDIRLSINVLPVQFEKFGDWYFQLEASILSAAPDPEATLLYLEEL
jgi:hypothetical protein